MLATGTADSDCHVAAAVGFELRQPAIKKLFDVLKHLVDGFMPVQIVDHFSILAGQGTQMGDPMWIGQTAHIEDEIGIGGKSVLITERLELQREQIVAPVYALTDDVTQLMYG